MRKRRKPTSLQKTRHKSEHQPRQFLIIINLFTSSSYCFDRSVYFYTSTIHTLVYVLDIVQVLLLLMLALGSIHTTYVYTVYRYATPIMHSVHTRANTSW